MREALMTLLEEIEQFGEAHDRATKDHSQRMLNITRETGEFFSVLIRATGARDILEIGTSNGYSTLWLAEAAEVLGGHVTTVDASERKVALASENFLRSGLSRFITQVHGVAGEFLSSAPDSAFDLVFLDSDRNRYTAWWPDVKRALRPAGLLVVDNATTHREELAPLQALVAAGEEFTTSLVPIGNGELLSTRSRPPRGS